MYQHGSFLRGCTAHAPVVKFRKTASYRNQQNALKKSTIPCNEIHSLKMPPFITDKLFLCRQLRHDHLPPQECHTCTAGRKTKERVQTGKSRKTSMVARCFAFAKPALPLYGFMQRFRFSCRQCIATSNVVTMSARSHDDSFAE